MPFPSNTLDAANSILFLGSGFSEGATNIAKGTLPAGNPLLNILSQKLGVDPKEYNLQTITDEYASRTEYDLYAILHETFTVTGALKYQKEILSLPWSRIYTTNYDDLISFCRGANYPTFSYSDPKPRSLPRRFAVQLHGSIRKANPENVLDQLVLSDTSYIKQISDHPAWLDEFARDRTFAEACYFLGYSLRDHHITALLLQSPSARVKTFFITKPNVDQVFQNRVEPYGEVIPIGVEGFAEACRTLPSPTPPADIRALKSFKYLDPILDNKSLTAPTPLEILALVTFGTFNQARFFATKDGDYVVRRDQLVQEALRRLSTCRTLVVHSRLGNGKTIFISVLARALAEDGRRCVSWRGRLLRLDQELDLLASLGRVVILFDDYDAAIENIGRIAEAVPEAQFVVSVRTSQQDVRLHEIVDKLPVKIERLNIDNFSRVDKESLYKLLDRAGAHVDGLEGTIRSAHEIRDIVTSLYDHREIRDKIASIVTTLLANGSTTIIAITVVKWAGVDVDPAFLKAVTGRDAYAEMRLQQEIAGDILDMSDDHIDARSGLLSEYLIQRVFDPRVTLNVVYDLVTGAVRRKTDRRYRRLLGDLMKVSTLQRFFKHYGKYEVDLNAHFNRLSHDDDVNDEPLFWLQYAILMVARDDLEAARHFLDTGYERARNLEGFQTYQLDTQALNIYLRQEQRSQAANIDGLQDILALLRKVGAMVADSSHRYYAIEVLREVPPFVKARRVALKREDAVSLVFELNRLTQGLSGLSDEVKVTTGSDIVRRELEEAIAEIVR